MDLEITIGTILGLFLKDKRNHLKEFDYDYFMKVVKKTSNIDIDQMSRIEKAQLILMVHRLYPEGLYNNLEG